MAMELITEAVTNGARRAPACKILGISLRTLQRWEAEGGVRDQRSGAQKEPENALSEAERALVVAIASSPMPAYPVDTLCSPRQSCGPGSRAASPPGRVQSALPGTGTLRPGCLTGHFPPMAVEGAILHCAVRREDSLGGGPGVGTRRWCVNRISRVRCFGICRRAK